MSYLNTKYKLDRNSFLLRQSKRLPTTYNPPLIIFAIYIISMFGVFLFIFNFCMQIIYVISSFYQLTRNRNLTVFRKAQNGVNVNYNFLLVVKENVHIYIFNDVLGLSL